MKIYKAVCLSLIISAISFTYAYSSPDKAAREYRKAADYYNSLKHSKKNVSKKELEKCLSMFKGIYLKYPKGSKTPEAVFMSGQLHEEIYKKYHRPSDKNEAVTYYRALVRSFPNSSLADDALFNSGGLHLMDKNVKEALSDFRGIVRWFPKSDTVSKAKEMIAKLEREEKEISEKSQKIAAAQPEPPREPDFKRMRYWANNSYARVVFELNKPVHYKIQRGEGEDRIIVDLLGVEGAQETQKNVTPQDCIIKSIELSSLNKEISRVMISLNSAGSYSTMELSNPDRIVVDINVDQEDSAKEANLSSVPPLPTLQPVPQVPAELIPAASSPAPSVQKPAIPDSAGAKPETPVKPVEPVEKTENMPKPDAGIQTAELKKSLVVPKIDINVNAPVINPLPSTPTEDDALVEAGLVEKNKPAMEEEPPISAIQKRHAKNVSFSPAKANKVKTIVVDPGHGGKDPGAIGPHGVMEKDIALDIALRLQKRLLHECGCRVLMTRSKDVFIPLEERTAFANMADADLFVSIHTNSNQKKNVAGVETYFLSPAKSKNESYVAAKENMLAAGSENEDTNDLAFILFDMQNTDKINESSQMAATIQDSLIHELKPRYNPRNNGVKKAMFYVLHGARMPSILVETSFISNPKEEKLLSNAEYRDIIAKGIATGVEDYSRRYQLAFLANR